MDTKTPAVPADPSVLATWDEAASAVETARANESSAFRPALAYLKANGHDGIKSGKLVGNKLFHYGPGNKITRVPVS